MYPFCLYTYKDVMYSMRKKCKSVMKKGIELCKVTGKVVEAAGRKCFLTPNTCASGIGGCRLAPAGNVVWSNKSCFVKERCRQTVDFYIKNDKTRLLCGL